MKATTRRGAAAAGGLPLPVKTTTRKKAASSARGFMCGCGGSKSVSIVASRATAATPAAAKVKATTAAPPDRGGAEGTPSVDALLRQLRELERGVRALGVRDDGAIGGGSPAACGRRPLAPRHHRRSASDWGAGGTGPLEEESVAVVTESADPLGDFRRSMVQMIVENEMRGAGELRALLQRFLALNSARHHHLILRAFADVWEELFSGAGAGGHPLPPRPHKPRTASFLPEPAKRPSSDTLTTVPV